MRIIDSPSGGIGYSVICFWYLHNVQGKRHTLSLHRFEYYGEDIQHREQRKQIVLYLEIFFYDVSLTYVLKII